MKKEKVYKEIIEHVHNYECGAFNLVVEEIEKVMPFRQFFDKYVDDEDCRNWDLSEQLFIEDEEGKEYTKEEFINLINNLPDNISIIEDDEGGYYFERPVKQDDEAVVRRVFSRLHYYYMKYIVEKENN